MAKATKKPARAAKSARAEAGERRKTAKPAARTQQAAMPRSMQNRGTSDRRKAVQTPRTARRGDTARGEPRQDALTRVTHETEVRGTETRVERVIERAPKPSLPDVDRTAGRGRYVYCVIRSTQPLKFGAIGMDEQ